jgi:ABC-type Zn uptake system ZnuABC Zn-binding protein ZnuA
MKKILLSVVLLTLATGCSSLRVWQTDNIRAVASTTFIADFLREIAGDRVEIQTIMREGANHHAFEASIRDAKIVGTADIIFVNGIDLEGLWLERLVTSTETAAPIVVTSDGASRRTLLHSDHIHEDGDPHIWHSTENAKIIVENIAQGMIELDPDNRSFYEANATAYQAQLDELAEEITEILAVIPPERRKLVTSHEAFGYFADQFGLEVVGTIVIATQTQEPDRRQIEYIISRLVEFQVPAIFTETSINPRLAEQIALETGVALVPDLYSDSLGLPGSDGDTYIEMMLYNAGTIASGLR